MASLTIRPHATYLAALNAMIDQTNADERDWPLEITYVDETEPLPTTREYAAMAGDMTDCAMDECGVVLMYEVSAGDAHIGYIYVLSRNEGHACTYYAIRNHV